MTGITNPTEEYFKDGTWGWDGTQWRKAGLPLWYRGQVAEQVTNTNAAAGANTLTGSTVPADEVWIIQITEAIDLNTTLAELEIRWNASGVWLTLASEVSVTANHWVIVFSQITLAPGNYLAAYFNSCTAGDDLYLRYAGYKVKLA